MSPKKKQCGVNVAKILLLHLVFYLSFSPKPQNIGFTLEGYYKKLCNPSFLFHLLPNGGNKKRIWKQDNTPKPEKLERETKTMSQVLAEKPKSSSGRKRARTTLPIQRVFSHPEIHPFDEIEWETRTAEITDDKGKVIFRQDNVEVPKFWSQLATKVVCSKYFYGDPQKPNEREYSVKQLIHRVCRTIADWGIKDGYFTKKDGEIFYRELVWLCVNQYGAFNSPVWFNVGLYHQYGVGKGSDQGNWYYDRRSGKPKRAPTQYEYPQSSACFIQRVEDNMDSIMRLAYSEAMLFKYGSGTGTDLTPIRSSKEKLSGGGRPSGPLSFLRIYDQIANVVKSGGKTRRAAKMNILKDWHGDIEEFITAKMKEERKAWALIDAGYDGSLNGEAYSSVMFQNENLSVRVSDEFMQAAIEGRDWWTRAVTTGQPLEKKNAGKLLDLIAEGTWVCGDPGLQFDGAIQKWHTCKGTEPINATNPCSEFIFLDNTACNLASLNLMKFRQPDGTFDVERFKAAIRIFITAQEILVDNSSYPTPEITLNSHLFRPLGLGYANLGALLMSYGLPYDSDEGRAFAAAITAILTAEAYCQSARIAAIKGPFPGYLDARCAHNPNPRHKDNVESMLEVIRLHRAHVEHIQNTPLSTPLKEEARRLWDQALDLGVRYGFRNAQATVLAPTGTIGFMMDCDTTGIEPDISLVKYKLLAGGGMLKIVNRTVPMALRVLGYDEEQIQKIVAHIDKYDTIEDVEEDGKVISSGLKPEHLPVFDCAFKPARGKRSIHYLGHLKMMAAVQPFISGGISKTINMPHESTVADIREAYITAWKLGLKCVAIYRDGSKRSQPVSTRKDGAGSATLTAEASELRKRIRELEEEIARLQEQVGKPVRRRLPDTRNAINHKFNVAGHEGYLNVGLFEDGRPGELFITIAKEGSTIGGLMDTIATLTSIALQYGVPLETLVRKFSYQRFEPSGFTNNPEIPIATSLIDYIFRWLAFRFIPGYREEHAPRRDQPELPLPELKEEVKKHVNKPVRELPVGEEPKAVDVSVASEITSTTPPKPESAPSGSTGFVNQTDAPTCPYCGHITVRNGACFKCLNCGESLGCS